MCVAVPGKVISITDSKAEIEYRGNIIKASIGIVTPKVGDFCLIHAGCVIEIISPERAGELEEIIGLLEEEYEKMFE